MRSRVAASICAAAIAATVALSACEPANRPTAPASPRSTPDESLGPRPSSLATLEITTPQNGATVSGATVHVVIELSGGAITQVTTTSIRPDEGHIHLYLDNVLVSMNYGTEQDVPVASGPHVLRAEFVAADHVPFAPRVWSPQVVFTVA